MTFAGFPTQIEYEGIFLVTTEPAPTKQCSPILTPERTTVLAPIVVSLPIVIFDVVIPCSIKVFSTFSYTCRIHNSQHQ